jgi:hypothetical protein
MKKITYKIYFATLLLAVAVFAGCSKDFLNKPPESAVTDESFYQTDDQVRAATSLLYSEVWFDYNDKALYNLGDFRGGSAFSAWNDRGNVMFNTTGDNGENGASWRAFYVVVTQANLTIYNINTIAGPQVSESAKKIAIAEARFMRALAYRYLVMNWGPVPIIENTVEQMFDTTITRNTVPSVWRFITREMRAAAEDLPTTETQPGRLTKWSAEGMLARFYLTRAGVEGNGGSRKQEFLDSAKYYAQDVINNSGKELLDNYEDLFRYPYDNNSESLFELQWVFSGSNVWGTNNSMPEYLAYSPDISFGGWGGDKGATWWLLSQYDGFFSQADGTIKGRSLDQRLHASFMLPGFYYPEITKVSDNQKLIYPFIDNGGGANFCAVKKYVIGSPVDLKGIASQQHYPNDTYMMRLAELYLVYAEAAIGNNSSTTDPTAIQYFNAVHTRAGLPAYNVDSSGALTLDYVLSERFKEFAMEGMAWYDFVSLHYWNPSKAFAILNAQDRGLFYAQPDQMPAPTSWTFTKTSWFAERQITANEGNFLLPIPNTELSKAPNLKKEPVDYP